MNSISFNSIIEYLSSNGIISSKDKIALLLRSSSSSESNDLNRINRGFICSLAQLLKSKSVPLSSRVLSLSIYNEYIEKDNMELLRIAKRMINIFQRNKRRRLMDYYFAWKTTAIKDDNNSINYSHEHFDFTITKDSVHNRLYNYYKTKESCRRKLAHEVNVSEAEHCTFIPTINHYYTSNDIRTREKSNKDNHCQTNTIDVNSQGSNLNLDIQGNSNSKGNQLFYLSTNPNTPRMTNKSLTNICMTSSGKKANGNSLGSKNINFNNQSKLSTLTQKHSGTNARANIIINNNDSNLEAKLYLTNQSSYNNLIIPNQNAYLVHNSSSKSSSVNMLSNISSTKNPPKTPKYSIGNYAIGSSTRESIGRLSKDLSVESLALRYPNRKANKNKNLSLKSYDNSGSINLQDTITNYASNENSKGTQKGIGIPYRHKQNQCNYTSNYNEFIASPLLCNKQSSSNSNNNSNSNIKGNLNPNGNKRTNRTDRIQYVNKSGSGSGIEHSTNNKLKANYTTSLNYNRIRSIVNNNNLNIPSNLQSDTQKTVKSGSNEANDMNKNLRISRGVVSEYVEANQKEQNNNSNIMNTVYTNQITLQTISDSKLYDIANHYITTDESLDKYSCISCSYRKCNHHHYKKH